MNHPTHPKTMLARPATSGSMARTCGSEKVGPKRKPRPFPAVDSPAPDPDALVETILSLLSEERFQPAQRLALEAAERFPEHRRLQTARRIFDRSGSTSRRGGKEPDRRQEFAWLSDPPDSVRGKWVALLGPELVGSAENLGDLMDFLHSLHLPNPALFHYIE